MDKTAYFVSVQARSVLQERGASAYEWEIQATPEEADQLQLELDMLQEKDEEAFPGDLFSLSLESERDINSMFQDSLDRVYRSIYRLGTPNTRSQMEQLRLLSYDAE